MESLADIKSRGLKRRIASSPRNDLGFAFVISLFMMATLVATLGAAALVGTFGIQTVRNYRGAVQVHWVAESAIVEAIQVVNGPGIISFGDDVVGRWAEIFGANERAFNPLPGFRYRVAVLADPANPELRGAFVATATGPEDVRNVVVAGVMRSSIPSTAPGALYLASDDPTNATFNGNAFVIDGNDRDYTGEDGPGEPVPAVSTRNETNTQEVIASLSSGQRDNLLGLGYSPGPPIVTSARTSPTAPSVDQLNQIVADLLRRPGVVTHYDAHISGNPPPFGTPESPQITYFANSVEIKGNGNAEGAGILIIEGDLTIKGNLEFKGLVIVRGRTQVVGDTEITGHAMVYGALWTNDINLVVGGSAVIQYSTQGLSLANQTGGGAAMPSPVQVTALVDCSQVPPGVGGCP